MAKLTRRELKAHADACALLTCDRPLTEQDIAFVLENWHEGAEHSNAQHSAFFTPLDLALHVAMEIPDGGRILDLCSGIGTLSAAARLYHSGGHFDFTLVELNPAYCEVAQRLLPDARVICGSIFDPAIRQQIADRRYDVAISNPPYGSLSGAAGASPRYTGSKCEYSVVDIASDHADLGVFLIPQASVPFVCSGSSFTRQVPQDAKSAYSRFVEQTGIELKPNMGIDTSFAESLWRGTSIRTEITITDFQEARVNRATGLLPFEFPVAA